MKTHQQLSDEDQDKFLARDEIEFLIREDEAIVSSAIEKFKRLADIADFVIDAVRPKESFSHPTVNPRMWAAGIGFNDSRPHHPDKRCPSCDATLVLKQNGKNGNHFWGCPNWRFDQFGCRITINISQEEAARILEGHGPY